VGYCRVSSCYGTVKLTEHGNNLCNFFPDMLHIIASKNVTCFKVVMMMASLINLEIEASTTI
jgi:hypothetical protein